MLVGCGTQGGGSGVTTPQATTAEPATTTPETSTTVTTVPPTSDPTESGTSTSTRTTAAVIRPRLTFNDKSVRFARPFRLRLGATTRPSVPVVYRIALDDVRGATDGQCRIDGDQLLLGDPPQLPVVCVVEASVPKASGRVSPRPVRAVIEVTPPPLRISVPDRQVQWSDDSGGVYAIRILEDSGDAYGMGVTSSSEQCTAGDVSPAYPVRAGTTEYTVNVTVQKPEGAAYTCELVVTPQPQDIFHDVEGIPFVLTVSP